MIGHLVASPPELFFLAFGFLMVNTNSQYVFKPQEVCQWKNKNRF